ncbi:hypothetical protein K2X33_09155, partial [bacterium]|nr:hypothetical protein [bacterium]
PGEESPELSLQGLRSKLDSLYPPIKNHITVFLNQNEAACRFVSSPTSALMWNAGPVFPFFNVVGGYNPHQLEQLGVFKVD